MRQFVPKCLELVLGCSVLFGLVVGYPLCAAPQQPPVTKITLKDAEAIALRNHPLLQEANFQARAAAQVTREEKSAYYPMAVANVTGAAGRA